jgi:hypothetical protein
LRGCILLRLSLRGCILLRISLRGCILLCDESRRNLRRYLPSLAWDSSTSSRTRSPLAR